MRTIFFPHAAAAIIVTGILLLVYAAVQQAYRTGANDPQIQIARDVVLKLKQNKPAGDVVTADTVNIEESLSPFVQVYGAENKVVASNGFIGTETPVVPAGVLAKAKADGEYMVTWQPSAQARTASVIIYTGIAAMPYVLAGRSLAEIEKRESALVTMTFLCWLCCMGVICAHGVLQAYLGKRETNKA
ncbi:MAG TPA: hypothetical protein VG738_18210 [Chitinophagaceae bacterium]|nr:hypothetical protein [Chitinophagaceae bacterium]